MVGGRSAVPSLDFRRLDGGWLGRIFGVTLGGKWKNRSSTDQNMDSFLSLLRLSP